MTASTQSSISKSSYFVSVALVFAAGIAIGFVLGARGHDDSASKVVNMITQQIDNRPTMPVDVKFRPALLGSSMVVQLGNESDRYLSVVAKFSNPTTDQKLAARVDLAPHQTKEIGHLEGWAFESGDHITIEHNDYKSLRVIAP